MKWLIEIRITPNGHTYALTSAPDKSCVALVPIEGDIAPKAFAFDSEKECEDFVEKLCENAEGQRFFDAVEWRPRAGYEPN